MKPEEQSKKTESCRESLWNEIQMKGPKKTEIDTGKESKGVGNLGWFMSDINRNIPTREQNENSELSIFCLNGLADF